jgi:hypothetical protein
MERLTKAPLLSLLNTTPWSPDELAQLRDWVAANRCWQLPRGFRQSDVEPTN